MGDFSEGVVCNHKKRKVFKRLPTGGLARQRS